MKKKPVFWIALGLIAVIILVGTVWAKQYYDIRYVGYDYYARVPLDYPMETVILHNMDGNEVGTGIDYDLMAFNEEGEARLLSFTVIDPDTPISRGEDQPQPGDYLWISASELLVVAWDFTDEGSIPGPILIMINANQ